MMNSKFVACLLLNLFLTPLFSQSKEVVDSLLRENRKIVSLKEVLVNTDKAFRIAKSINYEEGVLRAELEKIIVFFYQDNINKGAERIKKIEPEILKSNNIFLITRLRTIKGTMYLRLHMKSLAKTEFNNALFYSDRILDDDQRHYVKQLAYYGLAFVANESGIKNSEYLVFRYLKKSYQEASLIKDVSLLDGLVVICDVLGAYYSDRKDFTSAKFYLKKSLIISKKAECVRCQVYSFSRIGRMYYNMEDYVNAMKNYEKSLEISKLSGNLVAMEDIYRELAIVYDKLDNDEKLKESLRNLTLVRDSIRNNDDLAIGSTVKNITGDLDLKHKKNVSYLKIYIIIGSILCFILFYVILMYLKKYKAEKNNNDKLEKDLIAKTHFIQSLNSNKSIAEKEEELKTVIRMAIKNDVLFFQTFNELFPDFKDKLLQLDPFFKIVDLKFCSYLKLNFDTKEIARYTGNSVRSVESKKYRLRKKMGISSQEDINAWFFNL
ncbi:helix-turn-helix transcriptional regulator [Flavobacterium lipolyticum]|uniref:Tetratricopeptide repeat protein n=1 Tax=Flavobacterium lipolyticum TaxID=2893754 RepID=A0ABS8M410_9FLAO|nr:hypothetical protein [Flavobacterium sp. F-126]MCC9019554.1 hypothetical protein [Flavobacterium sp. F-126]